MPRLRRYTDDVRLCIPRSTSAMPFLLNKLTVNKRLCIPPRRLELMAREGSFPLQFGEASTFTGARRQFPTGISERVWRRNTGHLQNDTSARRATAIAPPGDCQPEAALAA